MQALRIIKTEVQQTADENAVPSFGETRHSLRQEHKIGPSALHLAQYPILPTTFLVPIDCFKAPARPTCLIGGI